jgi:integrase
MAAYSAAMEGKAPLPPSRYGTGSMGALWTDYCRSALFANLAPSSRKTYCWIIGSVLKAHGGRTVAGMTRDHVRRIVEDIGTAKPATANVMISVLRLLMQFAVENGWRADNPVHNIRRYKVGTHHSWTDHELRTFEKRWPVGTRERLAFSLLLFTGQRIGDVVRMRRSDITDGMVRIKQQKTGTELMIAIHPALDRAMRAGPAQGIYLVGDKNGRPIKAKTLSWLIRSAARTAGLGPRCVAHGLRKAVLRRLAEHGAGSKEIAAVSGHKSLAEVERYTEAANQAHLSRRAIERLPDEE